MEKTLNHVHLILMLNKFHLSLDLLPEFYQDQELLLYCCKKLEAKGVPSSYYADQFNIQRELVSDEGFVDYLLKLKEAGISEAAIEAVAEAVHSNEERMTDYSLENLIRTLSIQNLSEYTYYDYLKYFSPIPFSSIEEQTMVADNLSAFHRQHDIPFSSLSEAERALLIEPWFACPTLVPIDLVKRVCELLAQDSSLKNLVRFLFEKGVDVILELENYEAIHARSRQISAGIKKAFELFGSDSNNLTHFMNWWLKNGCQFYDLEVLEKRLQDIAMERRPDMLESRSAYINTIYGGKIHQIPLSEISEEQEEILIYAITNKKQRFLRLVEDNYALFSGISRWSILFERDFYNGYVNLNTLNASDLKACARMMGDDWHITDLEKGTYTFQEIQALFGLPKAYLSLYTKLQIPRVDDRLVVLRQLSKRSLLKKNLDELEIRSLASRLSQKPLSQWIEHDFPQITGLKAEDAVSLLIAYDEIGRLIPQMKNRSEALLVARNRSHIQEFNSLEDIKREIDNVDLAWGNLRKELQLDADFTRAYQEHILEFLCRNGAEIALTYFHQLHTEGQKEAYKRIVKAVLMGGFETLKYFRDDLCKEIDYPVDEGMKDGWARNLELTRGNIRIRECDDFYSTMVLGVTPHHTCLSYVDGQYNECLLSSFDTNKKVLYASINGEVVGRSIIRFTKGRFSSPEKRANTGASLSFVDLANIPQERQEEKSDKEKERLMLFLERPYFSGISPEVQQQVMQSLIQLMEQKATRMNCMLVLSSDYKEAQNERYTRTIFYLYISKSKAGAQYLDSLSGEATASDEGSYRANHFLIRQQDIAAA